MTKKMRKTSEKVAQTRQFFQSFHLIIYIKSATFATMKELLMACMGSFVGGGLRYMVGKWLPVWLGTAFPWATFAVNVVGCFLIGWLSGWLPSHSLSPAMRVMLVTGFCGGFTTFSTFMNDNLALARGGDMLAAACYTLASLALGMAALVLGYHVGK